jgi:DNA-binding NtrC family response regulator
VRELKNLLERLTIIKESGTITLQDLPDRYREVTPAFHPDQLTLSGKDFCLNSAVEEFENRLILEALEKTGGNKKAAAQLLNIKRTTLIEKLKKRKLSFSNAASSNS